MKTRVLLVDDDVGFVGHLAERLILRDYVVTTSSSGEDAIAKVKSFNFDVVVLDVKMPNMDGIDALREIKNTRPLTEVIMLTGHATMETGIEGMRLGAYDYLIKPCETSELVAKINYAHSRKIEHEERIRAARVERIVHAPLSHATVVR
jgi:DNA-binding response OmpR family regulator